MSRWPKLHPHQVDVLRRIADGGNPVTAAEPALAATVYALRRRHLVTTPRSRGVWTATITDAGRYYLEHDTYPPQLPAPTRRHTAHQPPTASPASAAAGPTGVDGPAAALGQAWSARPADAVPSAAELIRTLLEHPVLRVPDPAPSVRAAWRRAIHAANTPTLLGAGHRLRHRGRDHGDLVVELHTGTEPDADGNRPDRATRAAVAVTVPADLTDPHPVVRALQRRPDQVTVSASALPRALCLIQAFAAAATARGHRVDLPDDGPGVRITITGHPFVLLLREEDDTADVLPDDNELAQRPVYAWQRFQPERRRLPSGRLVLELQDPRYRFRSRTGRWADRTRWRLDDRLADALAEAETRAALTQQAEDAAVEAAATRQRDWEQAMADAHEQYLQSHLSRALDRQVKDWHRAQKIRAYAAALSAAALPDDASTGAAAGTAVSAAGPGAGGVSSVAVGDLPSWIAWMRRYADHLDPLLPAPTAPAPPPRPEPEDLRAFLGRWSPYGPDRRT